MNFSLASDKRLVALGIAFAMLIALFVSTTADAAGAAPCDDPFIFENAAVNAVVLPFRVSNPDRDDELSTTGRSLATLVQLEVLLSLIKYQSVGAVILRETDHGDCDEVDVLLRLGEQMTPGHGLILVSGRLYEQQDKIYVQTYARFLRHERVEDLTFALTVDAEKFEFAAPMPSTSLAFAPHRLSRLDIEEIAAEFREATLVRSSPDPEAPGEALHQNSNQQFAYSITEVSDGWMYVVERGGPQHGWIQARDQSDWSLRRKLPELALIDAIGGYLRLQVAGEDGVSAAPASTQSSVRRAIKTYREYAGDGQAAMADAIASILQGMVAFASSTPREGVAAASNQFSLAAQQAPFDSAARNLSAMPAILRYGRLDSDPDFARDAVRTMLAALALDPENASALANLETFYSYLRRLGSDTPAYPATDIENRLRQVKTIRSQPE